MGRRGNPYDTQRASFIETLKVEGVYTMAFESIADVADLLTRFIDDVYTAKRLHSEFGYLSPTQFEDQHTRTSAKSAA